MVWISTGHNGEKRPVGTPEEGIMRILIANDDGIYSPGIAALAEVASRFGDVRIVAPDVEQSSMGHAITHSRPLSYRRAQILKKFEAYRVNGTPADCVALGAFAWETADVVLSGINLGPNIGHGIWHSGTLAAAKQAALLGLRGIAFSTPTGRTEPDFAALDPWVERVLAALLGEPSLSLVNVNLPPKPKGICWTRVSVRHYDGRVVPTEDPQGRKLFWLTVRPIEETEEGTDRWAVQQGYVSVTPLRLDLTDHEELARAKRRAPLDEARLAPGDGRREREPSRAASERETAASEASTG
jgi:5'-nucleotidase